MRPNKLRELLKSNKPTLSTHKPGGQRGSA